MQLAIDVPEDVIYAIKLPTEEIPSRLKRELAVRLYQKGLLSFGKARRLSGMTRWDFHDILGEERIPRRYDMQELEEDLKALKEMT
jgi:predicted HTH domain antitoxin